MGFCHLVCTDTAYKNNHEYSHAKKKRDPHEDLYWMEDGNHQPQQICILTLLQGTRPQSWYDLQKVVRINK
jgi:hypothetical protein